MSQVIHRSSGRKSEGFTLLELLMATVIFSVIVGSLYSVFYGALRLREKTYQQIESGMPITLIQDIIEKDLRNIGPPVGLLAGSLIGDMEEDGELRNDTLECCTASGIVDDQEPWGDIQEVQYYLLEPESGNDEDGYDMVRAINRNLLATVEEDPVEQRLLHGVSSLRFQYYDGEEWQDTWNSTTNDNQTPDAISVQIEFITGTGDEEERPPLELLCELVTESATSDSDSDSDSDSQNSTQSSGETMGQTSSGGAMQ